MTNLKKIGAKAAYLNGVVALLTLITAFGFIGVSALVDKEKLIQLALQNPTPLIVQDFLKLLSAILAVILIGVFYHLFKICSPTISWIAAFFGFLGVFCLLLNAGLSLFLISKAHFPGNLTPGLINQLNLATGILGMKVIFFNGLWFLLINWLALKHKFLTKSLCYLGLTMGFLSLLPPLGIVVLFLNIFWSFSAGRFLGKGFLKETRTSFDN
jgi:hypothetical protein